MKKKIININLIIKNKVVALKYFIFEKKKATNGYLIIWVKKMLIIIEKNK